MSDSNTIAALAPYLIGNPDISSASKRDSAVALAISGDRVFPCVRNGKTPSISSNWKKTASCDPLRVYEMWTCPVTDAELDDNIGIAIDKNEIVIDVDIGDGKDGEAELQRLIGVLGPLPRTLTVRTRSMGRHYRFKTRSPLTNSVGKLGNGLDTRTDGGYVIGPGSSIDGVPYEIVDDGPIAMLPATWQRHLEGLSRKRVTAHGSDIGSVIVKEIDSDSAVERAALWLEKHAPAAIEGCGGDAATIKVANRVGDFNVSAKRTYDLMLEWNDAKASPPWDPDELAAKVNSAFKSRQNAIGIASPEAEFEAVDVDDTPPPRPTEVHAFNFHNIGEFSWSVSDNYLVQGLMNYGMTAIMSGLSNAGKSPLAMDLAAHVATGQSWRGRKVRPSYVLHISTEGFTGLSNRAEAVRREHFRGIGKVPFDFHAGPINLRTSDKDAKAIVALVAKRSQFFGLRAGIIVIDTMSHVLAGGDESNPEHVRAVLQRCQSMAKATGATVLMLHHPTKSGSSDYRGSSILVNDTDLLLKVEIDPRTGVRTVTTPRVKEFAEIKPLRFRIKVVELAKDAEGDPVTSVVVDWIDSAEEEFEIPIEGRDQEALAAFDIALGQGEGRTAVVAFMEWSKCLKVLRAAQGKKTGETQALDRAIRRLAEGGHVQKIATGQYVRVRSR